MKRDIDVSERLIQAVAVTAELCGRTFTAEAARVFVMDLSGFEEPAVLDALRRCRREVRGVLTVQDVVTRIDDGRPGPDEAWAMLPFDESKTVVWTDEMAKCWGVAVPLYAVGDKVGARMAFREAYIAEVAQARDEHRRPTWMPSLGWDVQGREGVLLEAVRLGRLKALHVMQLLPAAAHESVMALIEAPAQRLTMAKAGDDE